MLSVVQVKLRAKIHYHNKSIDCFPNRYTYNTNFQLSLCMIKMLHWKIKSKTLFYNLRRNITKQQLKTLHRKKVKQNAKTSVFLIKNFLFQCGLHKSRWFVRLIWYHRYLYCCSIQNSLTHFFFVAADTLTICNN